VSDLAEFGVVTVVLLTIRVFCGVKLWIWVKHTTFEGYNTLIFSVKQSQGSSWTAWSSKWKHDPPKFRQPFINRHDVTYRQTWFFTSEVNAEKRIGILIG
jgi:hypothetical protein